MRQGELEAKWTSAAEAYRLGDARVDGAALCHAFVKDVQQLTIAIDDEWLTLEVASRESGYSVQHLRLLIREGRLEATKHGKTLMVRRGALPKKARALASIAQRPHLLGAKAEQVVRGSVGASNGTPQ